MIALPNVSEFRVRHLLGRVRGHLRPDRRIPGFDEDHPCAFVLSTGRVGSKTLAALLRAAPDLVAVHEPSPTLFGLSCVAYGLSNPESAPVLAEAVRALREEEFRYAWNLGKGYVETSPQGTFLARAIRSVVPQAKFIHLVRHPADIVRSGMRRGWYAGHPYDRTRIVPRAGSPRAERWAGYSLFEKNLWLWAATNEWILDFRAEIPADHSLLLRAEDLFAGEESSIATLFRFLHAPQPSLSRIGRVLRERLNAQRGGEFPGRQAWGPDMRSALEAFCGPVARALGYLNEPQDPGAPTPVPARGHS